MSRRRRKQKEEREAPNQGIDSSDSSEELPPPQRTVLPPKAQDALPVKQQITASPQRHDYRATASETLSGKALATQPRSRPATTQIPVALQKPKEIDPAETPPSRKNIPFHESDNEFKSRYQKEDVPPIPKAVGDSDWGADESSEKVVPEGASLPKETEVPVAKNDSPTNESAEVIEPKIPTQAAKAREEAIAENAIKSRPELSLKSICQRVLGSLSNLEKASLGFLSAGLFLFGIWATTSVAAIIPESQVTARPKFPVTGKSAKIQNLDTFWRNPILEGPNRDEGVSKLIELIPAARVTLAPDSKAKSLRLLFRDEEGRFAGDATTLQARGGQFATVSNNTAQVDGATATIRATTGFLHEGEIISYLSNDEFTWHLVVLESADGENYNEFLTIPISAYREENQ